MRSPLFSLAVLCLLLAGCAPSRPKRHAPPLPPFPGTREQLRKIALQEAQKRLQSARDPALFHWRRLTWLQYHQGEHELARRNLETACARLTPSYFSNGQEPMERSMLAEHYLAMQAPDSAHAVLGEFRYQGSSAKAKKQLTLTTLTALEQSRLDSPDIYLAPRLVVALVGQGPDDALRTLLKPRLEFALMRGPQGDRAESFQGAIVLEYYLGDSQAALKATELQPLKDRIRTLGSLYWGGTISPAATLFLGDVFPAAQAKLAPSLRQATRQRLLQSLASLSPDPEFDLELVAILLLATAPRDDALLQEVARHLSEPGYKAQVQQALATRQPLVMPTLHPKPGPGRMSLLSRRLGRLLGMAPGEQQTRLLVQFLEELTGSPEEKLFAPYIASVFRRAKRPDLLALLLTVQSDPAFHCHQALLDTQAVLATGKTPAGRESLEHALTLLEKIVKPSHKAQEALLAQELARKLGDRALLKRLDKTLTKLLPQVTIPLLRIDTMIRLAGLHALCGNHQGYTELVAALQPKAPIEGSAASLVGNMLERLACEQVRVGEEKDAWAGIQKIESPLLQASALLGIAEQLQAPPPMPTSQSIPSLQNGGRGLLLGPPR